MCIQSSRQKKVKSPNYIPKKTIKTRNVKFWQNSLIFHLCLPIIYSSWPLQVFFFRPNTDSTKSTYSLFHKTLPKSGLQLHWTSVRFYDMGVTSNILEICNRNYVYTNTYRTLFIFIRIRFLKRENMRIQQILTLRLLVSLIRILQNRKISIQMDPDTKQTLLLSRFYTDLIRQKK